MNTEGNKNVPGSDDGLEGGDFDFSGFADGADEPAKPRASGEKKPPAKGTGPKGPVEGPRAGASRGYERPARSPASRPPRAGGPREGGGPERTGGPRGYEPRGGAGPRAGGFRKDYSDRAPRGDRPPRAGDGPRGPGASRYGDAPRGPGASRYGDGPRGGAGPRSGGPRGEGAPRSGGPRGEGGPGYGGYKPRFSDRNPRSADRNPRSADRGPGDGPRPFRPRGPAADRPGEAVLATSFKPLSPEVKPWLSLKLDKGRWKESRFLLEGAKNISDAMETSPAMLHMAFVAEDFKDKILLAALKKNRVAVVPVGAEDIRALSETETPQGIVAVCNFATLKPDWNLARYVTVLDGVQDPGNVGAIFRTSLALGMDAIVLGKGSCDPYNPKVVRSSVGALLGMPFETGEELGSKIGFLRQKGFSVVATSSHAKQTLEQAKLRKKVALIVGNEGAGTGASYQDMADAVVKIPLKSKVESLNVSVAHGILSYQLIHGRE